MPKRLLLATSEPIVPAKRARAEDAGEMLDDGDLSPMTDMSENSYDSDPTTGVVDRAVENGAATEGEATTQETASDQGLSASSVPVVPGAVAQEGEGDLKKAALTALQNLGMPTDGLKSLDLSALNAIIVSVVSLARPEDKSTAAAQRAGSDKSNDQIAGLPIAAPVSTAAAAGTTAPLNAGERSQIMAVLVNTGVDAARVDKWTTPELKRLSVILNWADATHSTYSINHAPNDKDWGVPRPFNDPSNILCAAGTSTPLDLWICGEITTHWWVDSDGYPAARPAISVQPLVESLPDFCKTLLNELCMPANSSSVADQFGPSQVKASRWMNTRAGKDQPAKTSEFKAVYDARKTLRDKSLLQQINVGQLKAHDFVVLEVRVGRYAVKQENAKDVKGKKRAMERWQSFFELQAVYKLKDAIEVESSAVAADFAI
ncbi:hypothetical protein C8F04DRAFT_1248518 [Mycena alexandri]|uniref:Uncharacterized protein n=1 Tax=Mycena alexandri TaxID=1745969 RepID=A0AAD6XFM7_9AGAR|nr:hypothetical protein C8F04DRAFT_1248518 [Mycena alexandri]